MRRSLLNKRILPKPLRQALVLITLLLLPSATWGEVKYGDGVELTYNSDQSAYIGTGVQWNVSPALNTSVATEITDKLFLTFTTPLKGSLSSITLNMETNIAYTDVKLYKTSNLSTNGTDPIGTFTYSSETGGPKYTFTSSSDITLDNEYIQVAFVKNGGYPTIGTTNIKSITLSFSSISYNLTVAGIPVTDANTAGIEGSGITEGTVTFTPAKGTNPATLTLNSATIIPESDYYGIEYSGTEDLTIILKGSNTVSCSGTGKAIKYSGTLETPPTLTFAKGDDNPCSLQLVSNTQTINGFNNIVNTGLYKIDDTIWGADQSSTYKTAITSTLLSGGSGTSSDDPIIIKTAEDLRDFATLVNRGTITNQYIKLNPENEEGELNCNGLTGFEPIGIYGNPFIGKFDGNNCIIKNLTYSTNGTGDRVGLFGYVGNEDVSDTKIEKLTLSSCSFNGGEYVGGIVGELKNGTIDNCVLSSCTVKSGNFQIPFAGGIAGKVDNGTINSCTFNSGLVDCTTAYSGEPSGGVYAGGIVGAIETENSVTVSSCTVSSTNVKSVQSGSDGAYDIFVGGIVGRSLGTVAISGNKVTTTDNTKKISCQSSVDYTNYHCGAIIGEKRDETSLTNNTYEYDVTTEIAETPKSGYTQRGIGQDIGQENGSCYDIPNQVMMAGTKKVTISVTGLSGDRTLSLSDDMESTYYLEEYDDSPGPLKALYVLPGNNVSLIVSSENGHKPTFTLSDVTVTTTPKFENDFWTIKYDFKMPEDDVTATIAFAIDLGSQLYTLETDQEAYPYTGEGIEPSISLTISTDQQNPVTLTKGTDYEILKCMKDIEGVFTPIFEEDGTTPKTPLDAGSYQVYISGIGSYTGEAVLEFSITKATTDECIWFYHLVDGKEEQVLSVEKATYGTAYDAPKLKNPLNLAVTLSCNAENGSNGTASDVATIDDEGNITILKAGTVYVYAVTEGNENYEAGEVHYQLDIEKGSLENVTITEIDDQVYTGTAIEPELTVTTPDGTSVTTDDYSITYSDNINAGEATITLTAKEASEKFEGSTTTTFNILQADLSKVVLNLTDLAYNGTDQKGSVSVTEVWAGENADLEVGNEWYTVKYPETAKEVGTYEVTVTANDATGNNFKGTATATFNIVNRTVTSEELGLSDSQSSGTYYSETEDLQVPEGVVAYIITGINGNSVTTQRVSYIPKGVAVLTEKGQSSESANDAIPYPSTLPLKGTLEPVDVTSITGGTVYVLYNGEFVKSTSGTIPSHRCYLLVATNVASGTRSFSIDHGDGTTALREVRSEGVKGEKLADGEWYTLQGQRIAKPAKGLYILNGKKVVIK